MLATSYRVIRVDLLGHGRSARPTGDHYGIPEQSRRVGAVLDWLGVKGAMVVGHSTGGSVATGLAEQRRELVKAVTLIDSGPSLEARIPQRPVSQLLNVAIVGPLIWRLLIGTMARKAITSAFAPSFDVPRQLVDDVRKCGMSYYAFSATSRAVIDYLEQRPLPERLAALGKPLLVIFGNEDLRWRSASPAEYRAVAGARVELLGGLGHSPMVEDPSRTAELLQDFADTVFGGMQAGDAHAM
jgi:pimeloyl-ACP methyl ester carboxylesterase